MQYFKRYYCFYVLVFTVFCAAGALAAQAVPRIAAAASTEPAQTVVVIDPGHGGEDGGAVSPNGTKESKLNLAVSLRLRDLLSLLGVPAVTLRTEDRSLWDDGAETIAQKKVSDLKRRVALVNNTPGALLVSIHQNSFPQGPQYRGAQVFYAAAEGSQTLAERLQEQINTRLDPANHRACKRSERVYLMEHIRCTGILLECGFLTNAEEERLLRTPDYQKQLACTVAACLTQYLSEESRERSAAAGSIQNGETDESKDDLFLHKLRQRNAAVDGEVSCLRRVEHADRACGKAHFQARPTRAR